LLETCWLQIAESCTHFLGIQQLSALRGSVALVDFRFDLCPMCRYPSFKFGTKSNLHVDILPLQSSDSTTQYTPVG
jgi:hypothetical protein